MTLSEWGHGFVTGAVVALGLCSLTVVAAEFWVWWTQYLYELRRSKRGDR